MVETALNWIKKNKQEFLALMGILLLGSFLRLYRISEYLTFLGDEGRDVIVVKRLLLHADPILVGPGTSIGNMYLGPLYYYFMAPWLLLSNFNPVGPAIGVAILGIITIWFVWFVARKWWGDVAAIVASLLYAVSPTVIIYSRASWNPNIMPFFALLTIFSIWQFWQNKNYKWLIVLGISFAFVMQSHYLGLLLGPVIGLFWLLSFWKSNSKKSLLKFSSLSLLVFAFLMSPLLIFDARHGWRNLESIKKFFLERQTTVSARPWNALPNMIPMLNKINTRLVTAREVMWGTWVTPIILSPIVFVLGASKKFKITQIQKNAYFLTFMWLGIALIGMGLYKQEIYDHYYGFFFAAPFLIIGGLSQNLVDSSRIRGLSLVIPVVFLLTVINLVNNPIKHSPGRQLQRTQEVADAIIDFSGQERFNLAVIAERNYDDAYQYFLEDSGLMVDIEPQKADETITDQLFVVCEMEETKCDPTHNPKAEVANFGWSQIENKWQVAGTTVYKLTHTQE